MTFSDRQNSRRCLDTPPTVFALFGEMSGRFENWIVCHPRSDILLRSLTPVTKISSNGTGRDSQDSNLRGWSRLLFPLNQVVSEGAIAVVIVAVPGSDWCKHVIETRFRQYLFLAARSPDQRGLGRSLERSQSNRRRSSDRFLRMAATAISDAALRRSFCPRHQLSPARLIVDDNLEPRNWRCSPKFNKIFSSLSEVEGRIFPLPRSNFCWRANRGWVLSLNRGDVLVSRELKPIRRQNSSGASGRVQMTDGFPHARPRAPTLILLFSCVGQSLYIHSICVHSGL